MPKNTFCPVSATADIVGRKWALIVIYNLMDTSLGFNELKRRINTVSSKTLSNSLAYLAKEGIVERTVHQNSPIRVEYSVTPKGREMKDLIKEMKAWGETWLKQ